MQLSKKVLYNCAVSLTNYNIISNQTPAIRREFSINSQSKTKTMLSNLMLFPVFMAARTTVIRRIDNELTTYLLLLKQELNDLDKKRNAYIATFQDFQRIREIETELSIIEEIINSL